MKYAIEEVVGYNKFYPVEVLKDGSRRRFSVGRYDDWEEVCFSTLKEAENYIARLIPPKIILHPFSSDK